MKKQHCWIATIWKVRYCLNPSGSLYFLPPFMTHLLCFCVTSQQGHICMTMWHAGQPATRRRNRLYLVGGIVWHIKLQGNFPASRDVIQCSRRFLSQLSENITDKPESVSVTNCNNCALNREHLKRLHWVDNRRLLRGCVYILALMPNLTLCRDMSNHAGNTVLVR